MGKNKVLSFEELKIANQKEEKERNTKRILFSPIGKTDMSSMIDKDTEGPLFHILREQQFDAIYFFLTKEVVTGYNSGNEHIQGLSELSLDDRIKVVGNNTSAEKFYIVGADGKAPEILKSDSDLKKVAVLEKPHIYNEVISFFDKGINDAIYSFKENNKIESDYLKLYFNVTSGTAAMQTALTSYSLFYSYLYDIELLQVEDPRYVKSDRIKTIALPHTTKKLLVEKAKGLIESYDYAQALAIIKDSYSKDSNVVKYIKGAIAREKLDFDGAKRGFSQSDFDFDKEMAQDENLGSKHRLVEYLNILKIKSEKRVYGDFYRALTPAITNILALVITKNFEKPLSQYVDSMGFRVLTKSEENKKAYALTQGKYDAMMKEAPELKVLWDYFLNDGKKGFARGFVKNQLLFDLVKDLEKKEKRGVDIEDLESIVDFEYGKAYENMYLRNVLAHQITTIDAHQIKNATGITIDEWFNKVWKLLYPDKTLDKNRKPFDLYDQINKAIIAKLDIA
jgi:hypothetical protein